MAAELGRQGIAHVSGIARCGSPWACPVCAPVVRQRRAEEIDQGVGGWLDAGHGAEFLTFTLDHHRRDELVGRLDVIATAIHRCLKGAGWDRRRRRLAYIGTIRAVEVTDGNNGWHPHVHVVVLFDRPLTDEQRDDLRRWLLGRWLAVVARAGFGEVHPEHGVDLRAVTRGGIGEYVAKVEGGWGVGLEVARADLKGGNRKGRTPWQLLAEVVETGEVAAIARWREYEAATFGKRAIVWSPGLRKLLLGDEHDQADAELAASEGADVTLLRALIDASAWRREVQAGTVGEFLTDFERVGVVLLVLAEQAGHLVVPLDVANGPP